MNCKPKNSRRRPRKAFRSFAAGVEQHLRNRGFLAEGSVTTAYGSPRRLAVHISNVLEKSPDEAFTQKLVPVRVGLAADGSATPALVKKMNALGITCDVAELKRVNDGKNEQLVFEGVRPGIVLAEASRPLSMPPSRTSRFRRS